ncbi:adenylate kinase [candidate division WOR-1 bacterium DG_54_3]|uniref:Adenylate kinase n=1 Tax=candidate division WOR-1 bacterium DG_54_3 TaxID=1703775 RepID=A0A0S7Y674_UNCSA|nr:MAG: adenylate kinase [candidate division WOR-1 bacterium DG_54_3]
MILALLGPPGSGKGTQAKLLAERFKIPHVSLGDILREEARKDTEIGKRIAELIHSGKLAPNELTIGLTRKRIERSDCKSGFILDGFPRSAVQAEAFDKMLKEMNLILDRVIYFHVTEDQVVERLSDRRSCKSCGAVFHAKHNPPRVPGKCDLCGGELYQRRDDEESAIRTRFEVYEEQTKPLINRYQDANKLVAIDASGSIKDVFNKLLVLVEHGGN